METEVQMDGAIGGEAPIDKQSRDRLTQNINDLGSTSLGFSVLQVPFMTSNVNCLTLWWLVLPNFFLVPLLTWLKLFLSFFLETESRSIQQR